MNECGRIETYLTTYACTYQRKTSTTATTVDQPKDLLMAISARIATKSPVLSITPNNMSIIQPWPKLSETPRAIRLQELVAKIKQAQDKDSFFDQSLEDNAAYSQELNSQF